MGRARKRGMDYFPVDVNLMDSVEIKVLAAKFGAEGFYLYMFLMCRIHLCGYYLEVGEDFVSCAAVDTRIEERTVAEMIELMCAKRLFDGGLYERYHILTSAAIQETYLDVKCKRGRGAEVYSEYWLLGGDCAPGNLTKISVQKPQTNADLPQENEDLPQTKCINKTKENETEENETLCAEVVSRFNSVCVSLNRVGGMTAPRKKAVRSALREIGLEKLGELFSKAEASDFLTKRNSNGWKAGFDWLLKPENYTKVLEGNYDNRSPAQTVPETDYTSGGQRPNILEMSGGADPDDYPF